MKKYAHKQWEIFLELNQMLIICSDVLLTHFTFSLTFNAHIIYFKFMKPKQIFSSHGNLNIEINPAKSLLWWWWWCYEVFMFLFSLRKKFMRINVVMMSFYRSAEVSKSWCDFDLSWCYTFFEFIFNCWPKRLCVCKK